MLVYNPVKPPMAAPNGGKQLPGRRLIGRDSELHAFDMLLDALAAGDSSVAIISGEPGIGKTALIGEVVTRSRVRGYRTLSSRASELERDLPFAVFVGALEAAVAAISPEQRDLLRNEELALAGMVFPAMLDACDEVPEAPQVDNALALRALHSLLKALGRERPMVLALDDLHWADPASIDLLCRLLHRGLADRSLLLLASRPGQSEHRVTSAFAEAELHGNAQRIELGPLSAAEAQELLGDDVDRRIGERLYRETGGNPFYLEQLAAAVHRGQRLSARPPALFKPSVPAAVSAAIKEELDCLSGSAGLLLRGAAIAGDPFDIDLAARTAGIAKADALHATDELVDRDLVRPDETPTRFRFRHPIVRRAVYETAGAGWRLEAHGLARAALEERGASPAVLAPHIERSAPVGDDAAASLLARAGEALIAQAPVSAARWLEAALRLTPTSDRSDEYRLELMTRRAIALGWAGQLRESRDELGRFLRMAPPDSSELRLRAVSLCARLDQALGVPASGRRLLLAELARLPDRTMRDAAVLGNELAVSSYYEGDWQAVRYWSTVTRAADCPSAVRVSSLALLAEAEFALGNLESAQPAVSEAAELFDRLDEEELDPSTATWLGDAEIACGCFADALRHTRRSIAILGAARRMWAVPLHEIQATSLAFMGQVAELAATAELAVDAALLTSSDLYLSSAMFLRSWASLLAGNVASAVRFGERSVELASATVGWSGVYPRSQLAWALLEAGDPARCREQLTGPDNEPNLPPCLPVQGSHCERLIRAEIALGNLARAEVLALRAAEATESLRASVWLAYPRRALALVSLARGKPHAAIADAMAACEHAEAAGAPIEAARSKTLAGKALAANGERAAAIAALRSAHQTLLDCGDVLHRDQAARELRGLGRSVPSAGGNRGGPTVLGLSGRECEVMELVAVGKRNREIAGELFLSVRTVERHIARIFEKLDVHSRAAASSIFERTRTGSQD
jgi:ATP/maltotriose-dependent transcriptional regulator MalT